MWVAHWRKAFLSLRQGMRPMTRRIGTNIPTGATGSESTPLQHAFIRTLLLSRKPEGDCSMCSAPGGSSPPDYAAIMMPTLMVAEERDESPLAGSKEIHEGTGGEKSVEVVKGMGYCFCIAEL